MSQFREKQLIHTLTFFWRQLRQANSGSPRCGVLRANVLAVNDRILLDLGGVLEGFDVSLGDIGTYGSGWGILGFGKTSGPSAYSMGKVQLDNLVQRWIEGTSRLIVCISRCSDRTEITKCDSLMG